MATEQTLGSASVHSVLISSFPVLLPEDEALLMSEADFQAFIERSQQSAQPDLKDLKDEIKTIESADAKTLTDSESKSPFIAGLEKHEAHHRTLDDGAAENKALTENFDVTNISSKSAVVNLFYDLGENTASEKLKTLLDDAWKEDPLLTLKIIFNARSVHLGKANRVATYKALGWLAETHPRTLLGNLRWLVRPVIAKKAPKPEAGDKSKVGNDATTSAEDKSEHPIDEDFDMIGAEEADPNKAHDVQYGVSHGYWKDLLNLVVFAANDQLKFDGDPASLLSQSPDNSKEGKRKRNWNQATAKAGRQQKKKHQNERVQGKLKDDPFYRALHVTVARLFAEQLKEDKVHLDSGKKSDLKKLSLAAKWAPTFGEFHDKHTFILSTIAEILFPEPASHCPDATNRELYLRHIRELYRKQYASPLRKALHIVERDIAAKTFENIKYDRVPSLAMEQYSELFMMKDYERLKDCINRVASGSAKISGATLLPSTLVSKARAAAQVSQGSNTKDFKAIKAAAELNIQADVINGQWKTLLQRVRDSGSLQSSIAVCDVSGSMTYPHFKDDSCPMDSAIGLSLLISEVTAPPFGGGFISFHETPTYVSIGGEQDTRGLVKQVRYIMNAPWGYNTNFVSVFENVILSMAISNNLNQEDMVKQVFVFSDMRFDSAGGSDRWTSSFERIKQKYADAGYEMPKLIFWNLAGTKTDKPATMDDVDTALVSGYSQGMLKALMETGALDEEDELVEEAVEGDGGMTEVWKVKKKIDPVTVVKKAVAHKAYDMLEVLD
ncbi:hypothetical protein EK21DRAFT_61245 [Setomelanomma holmii]|uniref:Uncharacterized protein n=1 Tax=Setomelanomma holmii TaxID=210430 RepID=A0A9P4HES6_9PLEO|nr:hypothetical protein EK21DRAFT_61245 [Setomelanomma holmii]